MHVDFGSYWDKLWIPLLSIFGLAKDKKLHFVDFMSGVRVKSADHTKFHEMQHC